MSTFNYETTRPLAPYTRLKRQLIDSPRPRIYDPRETRLRQRQRFLTCPRFFVIGFVYLRPLGKEMFAVENVVQSLQIEKKKMTRKGKVRGEICVRVNCWNCWIVVSIRG